MKDLKLVFILLLVLSSCNKDEPQETFTNDTCAHPTHLTIGADINANMIQSTTNNATHTEVMGNFDRRNIFGKKQVNLTEKQRNIIKSCSKT